MHNATARIRYTAADKRAAEAARIARLEARDAAEAKLSLEDYLEAVSAYAIVDAETRPFYVAHHAELVARHNR